MINQVLTTRYHQTTGFQWTVSKEAFPYPVSFLYCMSEEIRATHIEAGESRKFLRIEIRGNQEDTRTYICVGWEQGEESPRVIACIMCLPWQGIVEDYTRIRRMNHAFTWGSFLIVGILIFSWSIHSQPFTVFAFCTSLGGTAIIWYAAHKILKKIRTLNTLYNKTIYHSPFYECGKRRWGQC